MMPLESSQLIKRQLYRGFTLIETLIYLALFAIIIGSVLVTTYGIVQSTNITQNHIVVEEEGNFLLRKIEWALNGADTASVPDQTSLVLTRPDLPSSQNPLIFDLNNGYLSLQRGVNPAVNLNSTNAVMSKVIFALTPTQGSKPSGVSVSFTLTSQSASDDFKLIRFLRK